MPSNLSSLVIDANDRDVLARFWADALGWALREEDGISVVAGGEGTVNLIEFIAVPNEKRAPNWMHLDLASTSIEDQRATADRLVSLGARRIDIGQGPNATHIVLADPEGNEFCILEPGNGFVDDRGRLGSLTCDGSREVGVFWSEVLDWPLVWDRDGETAIRARDGGQFITFGGPPVPPKLGKNRFHIDVAPPKGVDQRAEVERIEALGARRIDIGQGGVPGVVMADPDGNEFCVLTPR